MSSTSSLSSFRGADDEPPQQRFGTVVVVMIVDRFFTAGQVPEQGEWKKLGKRRRRRLLRLCFEAARTTAVVTRPRQHRDVSDHHFTGRLSYSPK